MSARTKKKERLQPAYVIMGGDETKVETAIRRLKQRVTSDSGTELNVDIFDAAEAAAATVIEAASTPPFGEGVRLVLVLNAGAWHKADKDLVASFLADPPEYCCLALTGGGMKKNDTLVKAVAGAGQVLVYEAPRRSSLPRWAREQAQRLKVKLGQAEAQRLVTLAGFDQRTILTELEKLAAYKGGEKVEMEDLDELCWVAPEVRVWDLTDALGARDRAATFRHLEELMNERGSPTPVFAAVARHLRRISEVVSATDRGEDPVKAAAALGLKPFPAKKISSQSRNFTSEGLQKAIQILSEVDADIKGRDDLRPDLALERAMARVLDEL